MNANEVIANRATQLLGGELGEYRVHPNDHVNMAQSTNDVIPTAIRLGCLWRLDELLAVLNEPGCRAARQRRSNSTTSSSPGAPTCRTPCRSAWGRSSAPMPRRCERDAERIRRAAEGLRRLGIGGTAVGTGLNAHPEYHARMVATPVAS